MSAIAAAILKNGAILLSDGVTFKVPEDLNVYDDLKRSDSEVVSTNTPKIHKVNRRVGVSWVGMMIPEIQDRIPGCGETPREVAHWLSKQLKTYRSDNPGLLAQKRYNINIGVTGFDKAGAPWGYDLNRKREFKPACTRLHAGMTTCHLPFIKPEGTGFTTYLKKYNSPTADPVDVATRAFTEMIRDYEAQDMIVGGKIFTEVLLAG